MLSERGWGSGSARRVRCVKSTKWRRFVTCNISFREQKHHKYVKWKTLRFAQVCDETSQFKLGSVRWLSNNFLTFFKILYLKGLRINWRKFNFKVRRNLFFIQQSHLNCIAKRHTTCTNIQILFHPQRLVIFHLYAKFRCSPAFVVFVRLKTTAQHCKLCESHKSLLELRQASERASNGRLFAFKRLSDSFYFLFLVLWRAITMMMSTRDGTATGSLRDSLVACSQAPNRATVSAAPWGPSHTTKASQTSF